jgi:hypothetical protein
MVSDYKTLINKVSNRLKSRRTTNQHWDSDVDQELQLLYELQNLISRNMTISITHVRSHQELKKVKSTLSHAEFLNTTADNLTKVARKFRRITTYTSLPQNPIDCTINNATINAKYALRSKKAYHSISSGLTYKTKTTGQKRLLIPFGGKYIIINYLNYLFLKKYLIKNSSTIGSLLTIATKNTIPFVTNNATNANANMKMKTIFFYVILLNVNKLEP